MIMNPRCSICGATMLVIQESEKIERYDCPNGCQLKQENTKHENDSPNK